MEMVTQMFRLRSLTEIALQNSFYPIRIELSKQKYKQIKTDKIHHNV